MIAEGAVHRDCSALKDLLPINAKESFDAYQRLVQNYGKLFGEKVKDNMKKLSGDLYKSEEYPQKRFIVKSQFLVEEYLAGRDVSAFEKQTFGRSQNFDYLKKNAQTLCKLKLNNVNVSSRDVVVVFFTSGVSYNEVRALKEMEKKFGTFSLIVGGNEVYTPKTFIKDYVLANK